MTYITQQLAGLFMIHYKNKDLTLIYSRAETAEQAVGKAIRV